MRLAERLGALLAEGHGRAHGAILAGDPITADGNDHAPSAVLVPVTDRPQPGLILTQRAATLRKHAGQVALPGGRVDPDDADAVAAALREAWEEIALPPEQVEVVGMTDNFLTRTGFAIVPVLAVIPPDLPLAPRPGEVDAIFEVPLAYALDPARRARKQVEWEGRLREYHEIWWEERRIWGVTAAILANLSHRLDPAKVAAIGYGPP